MQHVDGSDRVRQVDVGRDYVVSNGDNPNTFPPPPRASAKDFALRLFFISLVAVSVAVAVVSYQIAGLRELISEGDSLTPTEQQQISNAHNRIIKSINSHTDQEIKNHGLIFMQQYLRDHPQGDHAP